MDEKNRQSAELLLGRLWGSLMRATDSVGAFVVWHDTKEIYADDNALALIGLPRDSLSYEALCNIAECALMENDPLSMARITLADCGDENVTAAFVTKNEGRETEEISEIYPVISQRKLAEVIGQTVERSFLMLIQIEQADTGRDERAFIGSALEAIRTTAPEGCRLAYHSRSQFWVFVPGVQEDPQAFAEGLRQAVEKCDITDEFGVIISKTHSMTFTGGYVVFDPREHTALKQFHYASFALYEAASAGTGVVMSFCREVYELQKNDYRKVQNFFKLLEDNSFKYHFQPIVSARDGSIFAYEALMRTDKIIGLNPLQILDYALKYGKLYNIEHATMFNVLKHLSSNQSFFMKRKLFINAIPSSFLSDEDWVRLMSVYGELMEKVVVELTEQTDTSDEKLQYLMNRLRDNKVQMAIDDYGTGYSNTSRLIKYTPDYIKLDHSLISGIDTNPKLQKIVAGLIEMMHANGFAVLAEGVETSGELKMLSSMKVDLFQGFYVSRPKPFFINEISEEIQREIVRYYHQSVGSDKKIYHAAHNGTIGMDYLVRERYNGIMVECSELEINGDTAREGVNIPITVKEDNRCRLTLRNVTVDADGGTSALTLGSGSRVVLNIVGDNRFNKGGILVPAKAELEMVGAGRLTVSPEAVSCFGIGNEYDLTYGKIKLGLTGELDITVCGDNCIGIGGCRSEEDKPIEIDGGLYKISCSGAMSLALGSAEGKAAVHMSNCGMKIHAASANFVGVGSFGGDAEVRVADVKLEIDAGGNTMCGLGSKDGGRADIKIRNCEFASRFKGRNIINIGSYGSETVCGIEHSSVNIYSEGGTVSGIGDSCGGGRVDVKDTEVKLSFMTGNGFALGCRDGEMTFVGGSKKIGINE